MGFINFCKRGRGRNILEGDWIRFVGKQGFQTIVPRLTAVFDEASDTLTVQTISLTIVDVEVELLNDSGGVIEYL